MRVGHAPSRRDRRRRGGGRRCYERGLVYLNNRYHDPTLGSFVSVDPLVVQTGLAYSYTAGDPIGFSDPSGLDPCRLSGKCAGEYQDQAKILHYNGAVGSEEAARCSYRCAIDTPGDSWGPLYGDVMPSDVLYGSHAAKVPPAMPPISLDEAGRLWREILDSFNSLADADGAGMAIGWCLEFGGSAGVTGSGTSCMTVDTDGVSVVTTLGAGVAVGVPSVSGSTGTIVSNADTKGHGGWGMCGNVAGGVGFGGTGALCGGLSHDDGLWSANDVWVLYVGASVTTPSVEVSFTYTYTWVDRKVSWPW